MSRARRLLALAVIGAGAVTGVFAAGGHPAGAANALTAPIPVDRQDYVVDSPADPYNADPSSVHVAASAGQEEARSFIHLALDYLPAGATPTDALVTLQLTQQSGASNTSVYQVYNVNTGAAIVEACALTSELPAKFDASKPPAYDCAHASAIGAAHPDGSWSFDLRELVGYWRQHGNTGAVLIPVAAGPTATWSVSYYVSQSASLVTYTVAPGSRASTPATSTGTSASVPPATTTGSGGAPAAPVTGGAVTTSPPPAPAAPGPVLAQPSAPATAPAAAAPPSSRGPTRFWPWVLFGCLALAGAALASVHLDALRQLPEKVFAPAISNFRAHPRAYAIATVAASWGLVFSGYSLVVAPNRATPVAQESAPGTNGSSSGPSNGASAAPGSGGGTGTGAAPGSAAALNGQTGATAGTTNASNNPAATEFTGPGTWRTISGVRVFFPATGGAPVADLYHGADDTIGISRSGITLCGHAALTYGSAFDINASDLNVYWDSVNSHGGINGRKVNASYENDNYDPGTAVQAAQKCKDKNTFLLIGGIGFDQIPAVRVWAEQNHELYIHHVATVAGSAGLRYSFTALPSVEDMGRWFGQLATQQFRGEKVGIIWRQSPNWQPARDIFRRAVQAAGMKIVGDYPVQINQANYTQELTQLRAAGAQVVFGWENALATTEMIKQAQGQNYHPAWLIAPFNIITNTLGTSGSLAQPIYGIASGWDAYDPGYYGGGFASYADEIREFEAQYREYDPGADLKGDGGDLLFLNWEGQKQMADLFRLCGPQCTRNRMAGILLSGYHKTVAPNCNVDFDTGDHHHGGYVTNVLKVIRDPNGRANFAPIARCVGNL